MKKMDDWWKITIKYVKRNKELWKDWKINEISAFCYAVKEVYKRRMEIEVFLEFMIERIQDEKKAGTTGTTMLPPSLHLPIMGLSDTKEWKKHYKWQRNMDKFLNKTKRN